jgi:hypothetical protein
MPTNTYVALDTVTLGSNSGPITFSNIPQIYNDLRLVIKGGFVDSGFMIGARVGNGSVDTGSNYSYTVLRGNNSSGSSFRKSNMVFGAMCAQGGNNLNNIITVDILNYSNTTTTKSWISRYGNATEGVDSCISLWRSTAAINTISIAECGDGGSGTFNYGNMLAGTTVSLYGIAAATQVSTAKATGGNIYYGADGYTYHTFTTSGTFTPSVALAADCLVVAGGASGGWKHGGGGGAGGLKYSAAQSLTTSGYTVTVGAGGTGVGSGSGNNGNNSVFSGSGITTITSTGGGYGGLGGQVGGAGTAGANGGSGGGGGADGSGGAGGSASPAGQGNNGAAGGNPGGAERGGGGGGAGLAGTNGSNSGNGGNGTLLYSSFAGTVTAAATSGYLAGGGGGGCRSDVSPGAGGLGGGGIGGNSDTFSSSQNGLANTGGGGGGGGRSFGSGAGSASGSGGSGVVIIRYAS